ncbi:MAG: response regulator transcription factor [Nocardioidaceae bacterium]
MQSEEDKARGDADVRILVVEDDAGIAGQLVEGLESDGYQVRQAGTGAEALAAELPDVVLLDLGLPDIDGVDVCRELRSRCDVPILVLTARGEEADRVRALDLGADDYLVKPFGFGELTARIRAVLRRALPEAEGVYRHGGLIVDERAQRVLMNGDELALTGREFDILKTLVVEPGRVVSREEIYSRVWDEHWYGPTKVVDVHVAALRRKLGNPAVIQTVYGRGFRLGPRP